MLTVWGRRTSSNVQALMWCIGELGLPFTRYDIGHKYGGNDTPDFLAINPNGTVPVLRDGDGPPLWETGAITRYLSSRYGSDPFWPRDVERRAIIDMWAEWAKINVTLGFTAPIFRRVVRTPPNEIDWPSTRQAIAKLGKLLDIADARLMNSPFICGTELTLADIQLGHILFRYYDIEVDRPEHRALQRYYERLTERPAFQDHVMVPYDELRIT